MKAWGGQPRSRLRTQEKTRACEDGAKDTWAPVKPRPRHQTLQLTVYTVRLIKGTMGRKLDLTSQPRQVHSSQVPPSDGHLRPAHCLCSSTTAARESRSSVKPSSHPSTLLHLSFCSHLLSLRPNLSSAVYPPLSAKIHRKSRLTLKKFMEMSLGFQKRTSPSHPNSHRHLPFSALSL